jgi:pimeloyl-ACP methyl ester carboxylesterase
MRYSRAGCGRSDRVRALYPPRNRAIIAAFARHVTPSARETSLTAMAMSRHTVLGLSKTGFHRISYCAWGADSAPQVLVCAHGLTRNARDFDTLAQALEPHYRIVCPDLAGRGQSEWLADPTQYVYPQYVTDMASVIARATAGPPPISQIDWVGTSIGALIGMFIAAQPGNPIRRLVMNDIGPLLPKTALERIAAYVGKAGEFAGFDDAERYIRTVSAPFGPLTDAQWRHLTEHSVSRTASGGWRLNYDPGIALNFTTLLQSDIALWEIWDRITCPVLVLRGEHSDLLSRATAEEMTRRGPRARVIEFAGVGHAPALMAEDQVEAVRGFLLASQP